MWPKTKEKGKDDKIQPEKFKFPKFSPRKV
jgi:hypothetical protein